MKRRIAVLDLGTNTFHLLIADIENDQIRNLLVAEKQDVKLGEGGITNGIITDASFERGIQALRFFSSLIKENQAEEVYAAGTAALRSASNGTAFIRRAEQETGIRIEIIDGTREAELIYKGVRRAVELNVPSLIMDIGGGSVEFIFCDQNQLFHKKSYPIGAARLMALFQHSDPISADNIAAIHKHLDEHLEDLKANALLFSPQVLIGSAGAFDTFAELVIRKFGHAPLPSGSKSFSFEKDQLLSVIHELIASTHAERETNDAIVPVRVDMIVVSSVLTAYILHELQIPAVQLSSYSLKEGILFDQAADGAV